MDHIVGAYRDSSLGTSKPSGTYTCDYGHEIKKSEAEEREKRDDEKHAKFIQIGDVLTKHIAQQPLRPFDGTRCVPSLSGG